MSKGSGWNKSGWFLSAWAVGGICLSPVLANNLVPAPDEPPPLLKAWEEKDGAWEKEVSLTPDNLLRAVVVTAAGEPVVGGQVVLAPQHGSQEIRRVTGKEGRFEIYGAGAGLYEVTIGSAEGSYTGLVRVWEPAVAPPNAPDIATFVLAAATEPQNTAVVIRGQDPPEGGLLQNVSPLGLALIGTGIAGLTVGIVALASDDSDHSSHASTP